MAHDSSVDFYTEGTVKMRVTFPHGIVDCRHCRFLRYREPYGMFQCVLTDEWISKDELDERNQWCPIKIQDTPF